MAMASLELKLTLGFGEEVSINLPECLADEEVVSLLKAVETKLARHLSSEASDKIKLLTGPTSCLYQNRQICTCHSSGWSVGHTNRPGSKPNFYLKSCVIDSLQVLVTCHIKQQQCSVILTCPEVSLLLPNMDFLPQSTLFSSLCKWLQRLVQVHGREIVWGGKLSKGELVCCSQFSSARGS